MAAGLHAAAFLTDRTHAADQPWHAVEQPELKQALEKAPLLETESLGEPARGVNVWERWMVPNLDGQSWDVLQIYFKEYYGPTWLFAVDLGTGEVKKQRLADRHQFYLSGRALGLRRQVLHRHPVEENLEHGPVRVRPGHQHAGGAGRNRAWSRWRGASAGGRA